MEHFGRRLTNNNDYDQKELCEYNLSFTTLLAYDRASSLRSREFWEVLNFLKSFLNFWILKHHGNFTYFSLEFHQLWSRNFTYFFTRTFLLFWRGGNFYIIYVNPWQKSEILRKYEDLEKLKCIIRPLFFGQKCDFWRLKTFLSKTQKNEKSVQKVWFSLAFKGRVEEVNSWKFIFL